MATTKFAISPMKVAQIARAGGDFEIVEREVPTPGAGEVRIKVQACGICHSDVLTKEGAGPAFSIPAFRDTKSPASSTNSVPVSLRGRRASASASVGTAVRTTRAPLAGAGIFAIAKI